MESQDGSGFDIAKMCTSFEGWRCVTGHYVTSREDRVGGQG